MRDDLRTVGVEEEFLLVGDDGTPVAVATEALEKAPADVVTPTGDVPGGGLEHEFMQEQIETGTRPCRDLEDLAREVRAGRARVEHAAAAVGAHAVALATSPVDVAPTTVSKLRYMRAASTFGLTAAEQLTSGCHVHVSVTDDDEGVAVLDRIGPWLSPLLALSANSPFWQGKASGYESFRSQVWSRWPTAGPSREFGSARTYRDAVASLVATGTVLDDAMIYFDARLSQRYPTVEIRVADVCLDPRTPVILAALSRALVETAARAAAAGEPAPGVPTELLRTASWRAGRSGLTGDLLSPTDMRPRPAHDVVGQLVAHVRDALVDAGDLDLVTDLLGELWSTGNGAQRQRAWLAETGDHAEVVARARAVTLE